VEGLEPTEAQVAKTEKHIVNVIPHHCGDHSGCKDGEICSFLKLKNSKPELKGRLLNTVENKKLQEEVHKKGFSCFECSLQLNGEGILQAQLEVIGRHNKKSIPNLAREDTTNKVEGFWRRVIKCSSGKGLNQNYSKKWEVAIGVAALADSNPTNCSSQLSDALG
jgi:hypothetical protein